MEVFTSFEQAEHLAGPWDELVSRLKSPIYLSFAYARIWWRHYGKGRELRVFAFHRGAKLVAIVPMFIDRLGLMAFGARIAKVVGCDFTLAIVNPAVELDAAEEVCGKTIQSLLRECDAVHFGPVSGGWEPLKHLREACAGNDNARVVFDRESGSHTQFDLPQGFDAYIQTLSKNQRSNYRRNINKLSNAFKFEVDVLSEPEAVEGEFSAFIKMHQEQWESVGNLGHFGDWPGATAFHWDLIRELSKRGQVRLIRMLADGAVVSYYFCFAFGGVYYWRLPARLVGEQWDQFALGRVGLFKMLEEAAREGIGSIEAGNGWYEYKEKLNAKTFPLYTVVAARRSAVSRFRTWAARQWGGILNVAYYRLWFSRIAPKLPLKRRPIWRSWIRTRF